MTQKEIPVSAWRSKLKTALEGEIQINIHLQTVKKYLFVAAMNVSQEEKSLEILFIFLNWFLNSPFLFPGAVPGRSYSLVIGRESNIKNHKKIMQCHKMLPSLDY